MYFLCLYLSVFATTRRGGGWSHFHTLGGNQSNGARNQVYILYSFFFLPWLLLIFSLYTVFSHRRDSYISGGVLFFFCVVPTSLLACIASRWMDGRLRPFFYFFFCYSFVTFSNNNDNNTLLIVCFFSPRLPLILITVGFFSFPSGLLLPAPFRCFLFLFNEHS